MNKKGVCLTTILSVILVAICIYGITSCGSCKRTVKNWKSDINAGVERTATLYDYNGKAIKKWEGKIDMSASTVETYLLIGGEKRVIIHGGIMVVEER